MKLFLVYRIATFLILLFSFTLNAQQEDYTKYLENALEAAKNSDDHNLKINLQYFTTAIEVDKITPEKLTQKNLDLYTEALYTATWKDLPSAKNFGAQAAYFLEYKIEDKPKNMFSLGYLYSRGLGVKLDYAKAKYWFEKGMEKGNINAIRGLAHLYLNGNGVTKDYSKAFELFKSAAEKGEVNAMTNLALLYEKGHGVKQNYTEAKKWYEKAAEKGDEFAESNLGLLYVNGHGVPQDISKAKSIYQKLIDKGNNRAINLMGNLYYSKEKNYDMAFRYYTMGCNNKFAASCDNLGMYYQFQKKDYKNAVLYYKKALELEHVDRAAFQLARIYTFDYGENFTDYDYAFSKINSVSSNYSDFDLVIEHFAVIYERGLGVTQNYYTAAEYYKMAIELGGSSYSLNNLGKLYQNGNGVSKSYNQAALHYLLAAMMGNEKAIENYNNIRNHFEIENEYEFIDKLLTICKSYKHTYITEGEILYNLGMIIKSNALKSPKRNAKYWFTESCNKGYKKSCELL